MADPFDSMAVEVRADGEAFARDVADLRATLEGSLGAGASAAARGIETALARAARSGRLEFEDLARGAVRALAEVAAASLKLEEGAGGSGLFAGLAQSLLGLPGRATGGSVGPGKAYVVGERGPELFVPTASGRIETGTLTAGPVVHLTVNVVAGGQDPDPRFLARTGSQVARALNRALARAQA